MNIFKRYMEWINKHSTPEGKTSLPNPRKVILFRASGKCSIVNATPSNSGWVARWIESDDEWSILLPGGQVEGTDRVIGWKPHSGWENDTKYL